MENSVLTRSFCWALLGVVPLAAGPVLRTALGAHLGVALPAALVSGTPSWPVCAGLYAGFALSLTYLARRIGRFHPVALLLFPVPLLFYQGMFLASLMRRPGTTEWKGRKIA